jgi:glyoxylase-like metal-dependent hydrolase (beta-lactamase superfamily II)
VKFRAPDITFEKEITLDLGGVTARLFWLGQAHTKGDELVDVEPDSTLISGDVVQNKMVPNLPDENASMKGWVEILGKLRQSKWQYVVPDHGALGDGSLLAEFKTKFTDWPNLTAVPNVVKHVYAENQ